MRIDDVLKHLFNPSKPTTTLIHELAHAVQGSNHNGSTHGLKDISVGDNPYLLMFEDMACEIYKLAIENGLFELFFNEK